MPLAPLDLADRLAITELTATHGHLVDDGRLDLLDVARPDPADDPSRNVIRWTAGLRRAEDAAVSETSTAAHRPALTPEQIDGFVRDGFVRLAGAFPAAVAADCRAALAQAVAEETGITDGEPGTWTRPVVRLPGFGTEPFQRAANTARLHAAFNQLVGPGRWLPREGLGTFPIRFPHPDDPGDDGWHMDGSYTPEGKQGYWLNLRSRERALLMLFLFSDTGPDDAPTRIRTGSHLDVPPFLVPYGERGAEGFELCRRMNEAGALDSPERPIALATGRAGDVYLCHPFLIHAAQRNRGARPRYLAQPPLMPTGLLDLDPGRADSASPVERAVLRALSRRGPVADR